MSICICKSCSHTDCGSNVCTIIVNVKGCDSLSYPGATVTAVQSGSTIASGTTDSSGNFSFTTPNLSNVTVTVTESSGRYNTSTSTVTPACGVTVHDNITLFVKTGYVCCGACSMPYSQTMHLTDANATHVLTWNGVNAWSDSYSTTMPNAYDLGGLACAPSTNVSVTVSYTLTCGGPTGPWHLEIEFDCVATNAGATLFEACSDACFNYNSTHGLPLYQAYTSVTDINPSGCYPVSLSFTLPATTTTYLELAPFEQNGTASAGIVMPVSGSVTVTE